MEAIVIVLAALVVVLTILFVRERLARLQEQQQFSKERKELRGWISQRLTKQEADTQRWAAMHEAYRAGWNDAVMASARQDEADAAAIAAKAKAKAKAKASQLTMK